MYSPTLDSLSDDLLVAVLSHLDCTQLRGVGAVCRRFAELLRSRCELWGTVNLQLLPKVSRGRDRRNSYTTPCRASLDLIAAWLGSRRQHVRALELALGYPDALRALPLLLAQLAPALEELTLRGAASREWCHVEARWDWLRWVSARWYQRIRAPTCLPPSASSRHPAGLCIALGCVPAGPSPACGGSASRTACLSWSP